MIIHPDLAGNTAGRPGAPRPPSPLDRARQSVVLEAMHTSWLPLWVLASDLRDTGLTRSQVERAVDALVLAGHAEVRADADGIAVRALPCPIPTEGRAG